MGNVKMVKIGLMKRFLLARLWLLQEHRRSQEILASAHAKTNRAMKKLTATRLISTGEPTVTDEAWKEDEMLKGNAQEWQVNNFRKLRNKAGTAVVVAEVTISLFKVHPMFHLISLLPMVMSGACAFAARCRF